MDRKFIGEGVRGESADQSFWLGRAVEAKLDDIVVPEPRQSVRRQRLLEVVVNHGLTYSAPWQVCDLSLTGAYLEANATQVPEGSVVEMVLRFRYKGRPIEHRLPATVTRVEGRGMALTFGRYDDETYTDLANLLYAL